MRNGSAAKICSTHGAALARGNCRECNAVYMRDYQRQRRASNPKAAMLERAKERAGRAGVECSLTPDDIDIPEFCPVLAIPIIIGGSRSANSPSLDRVRPDGGYTRDNVRVISSKANSMKGCRTLAELQVLAKSGTAKSRPSYALIAAYVEREALLRAVRAKAQGGTREAREWAKVESFLDRAFRRHAVSPTGRSHAS